MATIPCTVEEFNKAFVDFREIICNKNSTYANVSNAHKCLVLHYLGMEGEEKDIDRAAIMLEAATSEALRRGWSLTGGVL